MTTVRQARPAGGAASIEQVNAAHRMVFLGGSPFATTRPGIIVAVVFAAVSLVWLAAGSMLPGGRWIVVHMFTLGVLTPMIWTFSRHFAVRLTASAGAGPRASTTRVMTLVLATSVVSMLAGRVLHLHWPLVLGTLGIMGVVGSSLALFWRIERVAEARRFIWVVRQYRYAHIAFLLAAGLGGALGAGWIPGHLFGAIRDAHIHLNVLGWAGLTVLATLVPFGPALLRGRIQADVERRAAGAVPAAAFGLAVAAGGFVIAALGGGAVPARMLTVGGLAVYGYAVVAVAVPLVRAAHGSSRSPSRWAVAASACWLVAALVTAVGRAVLGMRGWWQGLAIILLLGALAQLVMAVLAHVGPMLRGRDLATRDMLLARVEYRPFARAVLFNSGIVMLVVAEMLPAAAGRVGLLGWLAAASAIIIQLGMLIWPAGAASGATVYSAVAARYRNASLSQPTAPTEQVPA